MKLTYEMNKQASSIPPLKKIFCRTLLGNNINTPMPPIIPAKDGRFHSLYLANVERAVLWSCFLSSVDFTHEVYQRTPRGREACIVFMLKMPQQKLS